MKRLTFTCALFALILSGCSGWTVEPLPYTTSTPFPTSTPIISSPTPIILPLPITATSDVTPLTPTNASITPTSDTATPSSTDTQVATEAMTIAPTTSVPLTFTPAITLTASANVQTKILGCSNGLDITHGMGEVTNAYITIQNTSGMDLTNVCATLNMLDEGRVHPDKTKCVASLPAGDQVTEKLTVDLTLGKDLPVQVDVDSGTILLQRVAQNTCVDFSILGPKISNLGTVTPIPTP